jgi:integrase
MPRVPREPRYFESRGGYYVQLNKVQHLLAVGPKDDPKVKEEAWKNFHALMAAHNVLKDGDRAQVQVIIEHHLRWVQANRSKSTFGIRRGFLQSFVNMHGKVLVCDLKMHHLESWVAANKEWRKEPGARKLCRWGSSSQRMAVSAVSTCLRWALKQGYISKNPLPNVERPPCVSRAGTCVVTDELHALFTEYADRRRNKGFRDLLFALYETGARPGEVSGIEAKHYYKKNACWVIEPQTAAEGQMKLAYRGKRRVIYLTEKLRLLVERLNEEHPTGPIFPNRNGGFYNRATLVNRFDLMRKNLNKEAEGKGLPEPVGNWVSLYGYRHKFATDWLEAGKPVAYLAELLGTSIAMIQKHYSHLTDRSDSLRKALLDFGRGGPTAGS